MSWRSPDVLGNLKALAETAKVRLPLALELSLKRLERLSGPSHGDCRDLSAYAHPALVHFEHIMLFADQAVKRKAGGAENTNQWS